MTPATVQPARFLLIEDDVGDVMLYRHALDLVGDAYELNVLQDGAAALEYIDRHRNSCRIEPCLIILDLHLPKFDGLTVLRALRQAPAFEGIKVAVVTTSASPREEEHLEDLKVDLCRQKPRDLQAFLEMGQELFRICQTKESRAGEPALT